MEPIVSRSHTQQRQYVVGLVQQALAEGRIIKPTQCQGCKRPAMQKGEQRLEAHHYKGYSKAMALTVRWLCRRCHIITHNRQPREENELRPNAVGLFQCPECGAGTCVVDSRLTGKRSERGIRRRRRCANGHRFTTYETLAERPLRGDHIWRLLASLDRTHARAHALLDDFRPRKLARGPVINS